VAKQHPTTFLPMAAGYASLVGHHRHLLDDEVRTQAFLDAIARVVQPGDRVVDLGTGTGVLAIAARRAGARHVWAIDHDPIVKVAAAIAKENGVDGITFVEQHSQQAELPEPIDVIVSECFGPMAVGGSMVPAVIDLRRRYGTPACRVVPRSTTLMMAPVEDAGIYGHISAFSRPRYGLAWTAAQRLAIHNVYNTIVTPEALVAPGGAIHTIDLERDAWGRIEGRATWRAARDAEIHGLAGWFEADLGGVTLSTAPGQPETIWRQLVFPIKEPMRVARDAEIAATFACVNGEDFDWAVTIGDRVMRGSTRYSHPAALTP
jgi:SAM-dependent methyltransferase